MSDMDIKFDILNLVINTLCFQSRCTLFKQHEEELTYLRKGVKKPSKHTV